MAFIPVVNVCNFQMIFTQAGQRVQNGFYFYKSGGWGQGPSGIIAEGLRQWWDDSLRMFCADSLSLVQIDYRDLSTYDGDAGTYVANMPMAGTVLGAALPNNVTLAISWKTARRGRSYRGRTYHLGLVESQVTGNTVEAIPYANLVTGYEALMDVADLTVDCKFGVVSRYSNKLPRATGVFTEITGLQIDTTVDSQRRRLPGRGK